MASEIRWGILSTARIGKALLKGISLHDGSCIQAVASREQTRAGEWAKEHGIPRAFGSYEAMLQSGEIDAVYNPLPNGMHKEWTIKALEAGLPVLCEKPFTVTAAEAREVAAVSKRTGVPVVEAFMYRFHPLYDRVTELIKNGEIGEVVGIRSAFSFNLADRSNIRWSGELAGGALMDVGCYCVNMSRRIAGGEPTRAIAVERRSSVDGTLVGILEFPAGIIATFECSMERVGRAFAEIEGTKGCIELPSPWFPGEDKAEIRLRRDGDDRTISVPGADSYHIEVADFVQTCRTRKPPRWPIEDAIANMAVIDALYRSARDGVAAEVEAV
jgi:D-xylose 1-dehydrogenase (NADP+, D-xylono-1,5-lactone-forming)